MPPFSSRGGGSRQRLLRRLDDAAGKINPFLAIIAIGLAILNVACLRTLIDTGSLAIRRPNSAGVVSTQAPVTGSN